MVVLLERSVRNLLDRAKEVVIFSLFGGCVLMTHSLNFLLPLTIARVGYVFTCGIRLMQGLVEVRLAIHNFLTIVNN